MIKFVTISFVLSSLLGFSQESNEELAVVEVREEVLVENKAVLKQPTYDLRTAVEKGFSSANAKLIAEHFTSNIDISLIDKENLYSKSQAEQVLKTFFLENKPSKFTIIHQGKSASTQYYIGALITNKGGFRITVNIKVTGKRELISHLTIEAND
mgnify:CR=1 FL=1